MFIRLEFFSAVNRINFMSLAVPNDLSFKGLISLLGNKENCLQFAYSKKNCYRSAIVTSFDIFLLIGFCMYSKDNLF